MKQPTEGPENLERKEPLGKESTPCLFELFERQVDLNPGHEALCFGEKSYSYLELDERANQFAHYLRSLEIKPGSFVGLYCHRSDLAIVGILGCLKAGAAYIPIDPIYPSERVRYILEETSAIVLLTEKKLQPLAQEIFQGPKIYLDDCQGDLKKFPSNRLTREHTKVTEKDLSYIIFTSGTTGKPKGVMTEHRNVSGFTKAFQEICKMTPKDRVAQAFSLSFDGSIEEIWMAFAFGATLVVASSETTKLGSEISRFLNEQRITYFSTVPTMLSLIEEDLPLMRLLIVSGERCPKELVNRWAKPGRQLLNVYGPTETTVNTTAADCHPEQMVTIGRPLSGYEIYILDEERKTVKEGEPGELFIGGIGVSRGYFKQPELTKDSFLSLPSLGTDKIIYRTGDLVRLLGNGEIDFLGRLDGQVKIRGFRVELSEIETVLTEFRGIKLAAVTVIEKDGLQQLAAFVICEEKGTEINLGALLKFLTSRLPHYMIPSYFDVLEELPRLTSGKVDRKKLPLPKNPLINADRPLIKPQTVLEDSINGVFEKIFARSPLSVTDDFFHDLGGHSLIAAQVVSRLRSELKLEVAIRDIYKYPTVRQLAAQLSSIRIATPSQESTAPFVAKKRISAKEVYQNQSSLVRFLCTVLQTISLYFMYGLRIAPLTVGIVLFMYFWNGILPLNQLIWIGIILTLASFPMMLFLSVGLKWLIIGRYKEGSYPLWGGYFFRWWLATRLQALSGLGIYIGTPIMNLYFRMMGARVGKNCTIDTALCTAWDMVSLGDDTSVGADTQLLGCRIEDGMLHIGRVTIGSRCFVGNHSAFGLNVCMEDDTRLGDQSLLPDNQVIKKGVSMKGSPCRKMAVSVPYSEDFQKKKRWPVFYSILHILSLTLLSTVLVIPVLATFLPITGAYYYLGMKWSIVAVAVSPIIGVVVFCFYAALIKALAGKIRPGIYPVASLTYVRKCFIDSLMRTCRTALLPLYTTIYLPSWLRLMGAKIGARAELSTVWYCSPELMKVGEESFFADGCIIGGKRFFRGAFSISENRIGRRTFVGNSAILPVEGRLGDNSLLGVLSVAPHDDEKPAPDGTDWLGSPAFLLPQRQKVGKFEDAVTYKPTKKLYLQRSIIDTLRILIPGYIGIFSIIGSVVGLFLAFLKLGLWATVAISPLLAVSLAILASLLVVFIKILVMRRFKPVIKPLWCPYVWFNEMLNGAYESVMAPALLPFLGTRYMPFFLRLMGCKIGKRTYIETTLFSEFDLVEIGDYAALNIGAIIQTHLFEDRIMKSSYLKIGDECSIGNMAVILYDAVMQPGSKLAPLSLLMKGETLPAGKKSHGIPNELV